VLRNLDQTWKQANSGEVSGVFSGSMPAVSTAFGAASSKSLKKLGEKRALNTIPPDPGSRIDPRTGF